MVKDANVYKYKAFLSYSHAADKNIAPALQSGLQRITASWRQLRAMHIYRDETDIPTTSALLPKIKESLRNSEYFILLASPRSMQSPWVETEIDYWLSLNSADKFLIVLTEGEPPVWDATTKDFVWDKNTSLPPTLKKRFENEPKFLDLRWAREQKGLRLRDPRFYDAVADLAASLRGMDKSTLVGEDARQLRKNRRLARSAVAALLVLLITASSMAFAAFNQRNVAEANAEDANKQRKTAELNAAEALRQQGIALANEAAANANAKEAKRQQGIAEDNAEEASKQETRAESQRAIAENQRDHAEKLLYVANMNLAEQAYEGDDYGRLRGLVNDYLPHSKLTNRGPKADRRDFNWYRLWKLGHRRLARYSYHGEPACAVAISPDSTIIAVAFQNVIKLLDAHTLTELGSLVGHTEAVTTMAFSPDHKKLVSGGVGNTAKLWDVNLRRELTSLSGHSEEINAVAFSPDGNVIATGSGNEEYRSRSTDPDVVRDYTVRLWDSDGKPIVVLGSHTRAIEAVTFSPDSSKLASGDRRGEVRIWDVKSMKEQSKLFEFRPGDQSIAALFFSRSQKIFPTDGDRLYVTGEDSELKMWDTAETQVARTEGRGQVARASFSQNGKFLMTFAPFAGGYEIWSFERVFEKLSTPKWLPKGVFTLSPNGATVITAFDQVVELWDLQTLPELSKLKYSRGELDGSETFVTFAADGKTFFTQPSFPHSSSGLILWDTQSRQKLASIALTGSDKFALSQDGKILAVLQDNGIQKLLDTRTGKEMNRLSENALRKSFTAHSLTWVTKSDHNRIDMRDLVTGHESSIPVHTTGPPLFAFSPQGTLLCIADAEEGTIKVWDVKARKERTQLIVGSPIRRITFSPDGNLLAAVSMKAVIIWNWQTREHPKVLYGHLAGVVAVSFSPDGVTLASVDNDGVVKLWYLRTMQEAATLRERGIRGGEIAFSPDGRTLVAGGGGRFTFWYAATENEVKSYK